MGFVEKPDTVWISMDSPREELMDKLEEAKLTKLSSVEVGCVAATIFSEDEALYRVAVLGVEGTEVEVRYCDYGNVERKGVGELFRLPEDLARHEQLAVRVRVDGVKGVADSSKNRARVEKKLSVDGLMVRLVEENGMLVGTFEVGGKKIKFSKSKDIAGSSAVESKIKAPKDDKEIKSKVESTRENSENGIMGAVPKSSSDTKDVKVCVQGENVQVKSGGDADVPKKEARDVSKVDGVDELVVALDAPNVEDKEASKTEVLQEVITDVKILKSSNKIVMFNELPKLKLLEGVEISGTVVYVSSLGGVWFCPQWIQGPLDTLTVQIDSVAAENMLVTMCRSSMKEGILCVARSPQDGELYRARVVGIDNNRITVAFIDFGNSDLVSEADIYELPHGLEMLAPASAEVVLARELPKQNTQQVLEETLTEVSCMLMLFIAG